MLILFVCTGNTCRSCLAEAIFNSTCKDKNMKAISAGIAVITDSITSKNSAEIIKKYTDKDFSNRKAVQLTESMLEKADIVLTMTSKMKNFLVKNFNEFSEKIYNLNEYVGVKGEIIDPYGGDINVYFETYNELKIYIELLIKKLKEDKSII